jgi:predicted  nucleic acid-binding Zn-ribbon protein
MKSTTSALLSLAFLSSSLTLGLGGCGEIKKAGECNAVIDVLNAGQQHQPKGKEDTLAEDIKGLEEWEAKVAKVEVTDAELKTHVDGYRDMIKTMITSFKKLESTSKAMDGAKDPAQLEKLSKELEEVNKSLSGIEKTEDDLVSKINGYCSRK